MFSSVCKVMITNFYKLYNFTTCTSVQEELLHYLPPQHWWQCGASKMLKFFVRDKVLKGELSCM